MTYQQKLVDAKPEPADTFRRLSPKWHNRFVKGLTATSAKLNIPGKCVVGDVWNRHKGRAGYLDCKKCDMYLTRVVGSSLLYAELRPQAIRDCELFCKHFEKVHMK